MESNTERMLLRNDEVMQTAITQLARDVGELSRKLKDVEYKYAKFENAVWKYMADLNKCIKLMNEQREK